MDGLWFAWPYLVIVIILLGATFYSLKYDERPILFKPRAKKQKYQSKHGANLKERLMKGDEDK